MGSSRSPLLLSGVLVDPVPIFLPPAVTEGWTTGRMPQVGTGADTWTSLVSRDDSFYGVAQTNVPMLGASTEGALNWKPTGPLAFPNVRNWLLQSQTLSTAPWGASMLTVNPTAVMAPDGTMTGNLITTTGADAAIFIQDVAAPSADLCYSIYVKNGNVTGPDGTVGSYGIYNLTTGHLLVMALFDYVGKTFFEIVGDPLADNTVVTVTAAANGWSRLSIRVLSGFSTGDNLRFYVGCSGSHPAANLQYAVWGAQLENSHTDYYPVPGEYAVTTTANATTPRATTTFLIDGRKGASVVFDVTSGNMIIGGATGEVYMTPDLGTTLTTVRSAGQDGYLTNYIWSAGQSIAGRVVLLGCGQDPAVPSNTYRMRATVSTDGGVTWDNGIYLPDPTSGQNGVRLKFGAGRFLAIAFSTPTNKVSWSTNGKAWTTVTLPVVISPAGLVYGKDRFIIVSEDHRILISDDLGDTWRISQQMFPAILIGPGAKLSLASNNQVFGAIHQTGKFWTSYDGETWTVPTAAGTLPQTGQWRFLSYNGFKFTATGYRSSGQPGLVAQLDYSGVQLPLLGHAILQSSTDLRDMVFYNKNYVSIGRTSTLTSSNLTSWNTGALFTSSATTAKLATAGDTVLALNDATLQRTTDLVTWTDRTNSLRLVSPNSSLRWLGYLGDQFFATGVGAHNVCWTPNGLTWFADDFGFADHTWMGGAYGNLYYALWGLSPTNTVQILWTDHNRLLWFKVDLDTTFSMVAGTQANTKIRFLNGQFFCFGFKSLLQDPNARGFATANTPQFWVLHDMGLGLSLPGRVQDMGYDGTRYIALVSKGDTDRTTQHLYVSTDATTWTLLMDCPYPYGPPMVSDSIAVQQQWMRMRTLDEPNQTIILGKFVDPNDPSTLRNMMLVIPYPVPTP